VTQLGHCSDIGTDYPRGTRLVVIGRGQTAITEINAAEGGEWEAASAHIDKARVQQMRQAINGWAVIISADRVACSDLDSDRAVSAYAPLRKPWVEKA